MCVCVFEYDMLRLVAPRMDAILQEICNRVPWKILVIRVCFHESCCTSRIVIVGLEDARNDVIGAWRFFEEMAKRAVS